MKWCRCSTKIRPKRLEGGEMTHFRAAFVFFGLTIFLYGMGNAAEIDPQIEMELQSQDTVPVIVRLEESHEGGDALHFLPDTLSRKTFLEEKRRSFHQTFLSFRPQVQNFRQAIPEQNFGEIWLIGAITLRVNEALLEELRNDPKVLSIHLDRTHYLPQPQTGYLDHEEGYTWGLKKLKLPVLNLVASDLTGKGVVAGVIDTGIDATHPDLQGKILYFKDFSSNPEGEWTLPTDDHGHGTHVAGTIAGGSASGKAIGVAPETTLVVARIFDANGMTSTRAILNAMQWMADPDENFETDEDVPRIVNNSWGGSGGGETDSPLYMAVESWRTLQIFPCFAAGNSGPGVGTVGTPGGFDNAFAVGATDEKDEIAYFSSRGPAWLDGEILDKPDASAPGVDVFSSIPGGGYASWSGTSMATPHMTGVIVLLFQQYPFLTVERMTHLLIDSVDDLGVEGFDYSYGFGRVNLLRAALDYNY